MDSKTTDYFATERVTAGVAGYARALARCVDRTRALLPQAGLRNPRIACPTAASSGSGARAMTG